MLKPNKPMTEFEKFGFKKCKGSYGKVGCYYLCVACGSKMLFVSEKIFYIIDWKDNDPRIHKNPNCRYSDKRDYMDMIYDLIKNDMLKKE